MEKIETTGTGFGKKYRLWEVVSWGLGVFLSTVSARMSHEQFQGRFGKIPYIPETWAHFFVTQADVFAIGLAVLIFTFTLLLFNFAIGFTANLLSAFKKNTRLSKEVSVMNTVIQGVATIFLAVVVFMAVSFSWSQTNIIATTERSTVEQEKVTEHPLYLRYAGQLEQDEKLYQNAKSGISEKEIAALEWKATKARNDGRFYRDHVDPNIQSRERFETFYEQAAGFVQEIENRRERYRRAEEQFANSAKRLNAIADSLAGVQQNIKLADDQRIGPILEMGIVTCGLLAWIFGAFARGYFVAIAPCFHVNGWFLAKGHAAENDKDGHIRPESDNGTARDEKVWTNEEVLEQLKKDGYKVEKKKESPFEVSKDYKKQKEILSKWLREQYDAGETPQSGVQSVIRDWIPDTAMARATKHNLAHKVYKDWKKAQMQPNKTDEPSDTVPAGNDDKELARIRVGENGIQVDGDE